MAAIHKPAPMDVTNANKMNNGRLNMRQVGQKPNQAISQKRIAPDIKKSTKLTITELVGITSRGK